VAVRVRAGHLRHQVTLENPTSVTADADGGFDSSDWTELSPSPVSASVEPATQRSLERIVSNTVAADVSHVVTIRYHEGVTTKTRVTLNDRTLHVVGIQNPEERNIALVLACVERVA